MAARSSSAGHGGPSHQRRKGAGRTTDHDVLGTGALEPDGIDEDVEQEPAQSQPGAQRVDRYQNTAKAATPRPIPKASPAGGEIRPAGMGRSLVRLILSSMSRSNHMLMALAPPAIK